MKLKLSLAATCLALASATSVFADYCINKDLINLGPTAYDIAVTITGNQPLSWQYDGNADLLFKTFSMTPAGGNETLHWQNGNGVNAPIPTSKKIHVGWCTVRPNDIADMFWTDKAGNRIPGRVCESWSHQSNDPRPGVIWNNLFAVPVVVSNVSFALSATPWPLEQLNADNQVLAEQLSPLPGGTSFQVAPANQSPSFAVPNAAPGQWLVLRYSVLCNGTQAQTTDFAQFQLVSSAQ